MDKPSLDGVLLKIAHADEHLARLNTERTALLSSKRNRVIGYFDPDASEYVFRVSGPQPPLEWGLWVGEFAHLLRSALDNLLWQLVLARGGVPMIPDTQFPIFEDKAKFDGKTHGTSKGLWMLSGVLDEDVAFIERLQPYHARQHPTTVAQHPHASAIDFALLSDRSAAWHPLALLDT